MASSRGWEVVHTFKDVGRSGWDPNAVRPASENLLSAVRAGEADVVVIARDEGGSRKYIAREERVTLRWRHLATDGDDHEEDEETPVRVFLSGSSAGRVRVAGQARSARPPAWLNRKSAPPVRSPVARVRGLLLARVRSYAPQADHADGRP
ncbi:recombinase family protein [Streptomyces sp. NPDC088707]|uniref:recombinase family protein n=1 Tax=Streptomyces sp. NPDC088707 TaxID=3365871 RepID=UPI0037F4DCE3